MRYDFAVFGATGLQGRIVGQVQQAVDGKTGVEIEPRPRKVVYFSGKE